MRGSLQVCIPSYLVLYIMTYCILIREQDLYLHSWQMLEIILKNEELHDIVIDVGMPVQHRNVRYNCRLILLK
jgi:hypothetical protein